ncbi:MAG TPA: hypothetical protein VLL98_04660, partial [Rickettsiales bacterium]|nr:hypothetical protein [Rickettsiales bacterium]
ILISLRTTLENEQKATIAFMERFKNIDDVLSSNIEEISQNIKCAGMPQNKAKSILEASKFIKSNFDNNWDFIKKMDLAKAREYILKISGVGEKSADCILELGLDLPSMVIDVNMLRIVSRIFNMEWAENPDLSNKKQLTKCKELLENNLSKDGFLFQIIHTLLLVHGKYICKSMPKCNECKIKKYCSFKNQQG